tara:strand:- start:96 stop:1883 length:1788 start_codon:yes stop_codon:yes gene_type:complete
MSKKKIPISYTDRDFNSIKKSLVEHARRYYPDTYKDFNEASFGSLLLDSVAYVGDVLSFYLDYQANESFLETSIEKENIISLSKNLGYRYSDAVSSFGECDFFVTIPARNAGPDLRYAPVLKAGSEVTSQAGGRYTLLEDVDFANNSNQIVVSDVDQISGAPTKFAIKSTGQVKSGFVQEFFVNIGEYERFKKVSLEAENILEVVSVEDEEGHEYYEVGHLSQDVIYVDVSNRSSDKERVKNIIKPLSVPRRFVANFFPGSVELQFGQGSDLEILSSSYADPSEVVMRQFGKSFVSDTYLDPTNFTKTEKMGVSPSNTTLSVKLRRTEIENVNAPAGSLDRVSSAILEFTNENQLVRSRVTDVRDSIECENEFAVVGDLTLPDEEEIKLRARNSFSSQNRAVTMQDYVTMTYALPAKFGAIKRTRVEVDKDSFKRNINLYVISEDDQGKFISSSPTLKNNLKTWVQTYKMMGDTFDIMDARVINFGIDYTVVVAENVSKVETIALCNREIEELFRIHPEIGESLYINDIYKALNRLDQVVDVTDVEIKSISGGDYSSIPYSIRANLSLDGRVLKVPFDHVYEIKFPATDIRGTTV